MSVAIADYDNDGLPDIFVTNDKLFNSFITTRPQPLRGGGFELGVALPSTHLISAMGATSRFEQRRLSGYCLARFRTKPSHLQNVSGTSFQGHGAEQDDHAQQSMSGTASTSTTLTMTVEDIFVSRGDVASPNMADAFT